MSADPKWSSQNNQFNFFYFFIALMAILLIQDAWQNWKKVDQVPYNTFQTYLEEGRVKSIIIGKNQITGELLETREDEKKRFATKKVETDLVTQLEKYDIRYERVIESTFFRDLLSWLIPIFIFIAIWMFMLKRMAEKGGGGMGSFMSIGKSKAKIYMEKNTGVCFDDVAGVDEAKAELQEVVDFLKEPKRYQRLGGRMPKGVLLVGPPGTGKTVMAKAVAGESGVTFFSISGSDFVEMFVGVGAARVRDLFQQAHEKAPCIIFIDELDALGKARGGGGPGGGNDEKEQTLNQLLSELDGFESTEGIILLAATNRPEILDPALLRAGRFDRQVLVDRPDKRGRIEILNVHVKKIQINKDVELDQVAALTTGFTGADLANLVNEAAIFATRRDAEKVELEDFTSAIERIVAGLERKNRLLNKFEREVVAHHEMGHTLVSAALSLVDKVHKVSIIPRGIGSLGYTIQRPTEDRYLMRYDELIHKMAVLYGGRVAEKIIFDHLSTGASDDISKATDIARNMVTKYGMDKDLGNVAYEVDRNTYLGEQRTSMRHISEQTSQNIDAAVLKITQEAYDRAHKILISNEELLRDSAQRLLEEETLEQEQLEKIFSKIQKES